jgi:Flp pilus assembly protein TadD
MANGAADTALRVSRQVVAGDSRNISGLQHQGDAEYALGEVGAAAESFTRIMAIDPDNEAAGLGLGRLALAHDPAKAEALFAHIVALKPRQAAALTDLGIARDLLGRHVEAQIAYRQALAVDPTRSAASVNLGLSLALDGHPEEALVILRPLAQRSDASPRVRQDLAAALVLAGDRAEAAALLRQDMTPDAVQVAITGYHSLHAPMAGE